MLRRVAGLIVEIHHELGETGSVSDQVQGGVVSRGPRGALLSEYLPVTPAARVSAASDRQLEQMLQPRSVGAALERVAQRLRRGRR